MEPVSSCSVAQPLRNELSEVGMMLASPTAYALESESRSESVMGAASSRLGLVDDQNKKKEIAIRARRAHCCECRL